MKQIYFNEPQRLTQLIGANTTVIVAGRRTGKTDSIAAPFVLRNMQRMPGSTGGIVVPTFKHGLQSLDNDIERYATDTERLVVLALQGENGRRTDRYNQVHHIRNMEDKGACA